MRSSQEINNEYTQICTQLGDIGVKIHDLEATKARLMARVAELVAEKTQVDTLEQAVAAAEKAKAETTPSAPPS